MQMDATAALALLPFAAAISLWVAWSDMKFMRIPNVSVVALTGVFAVVGLAFLPLDDWLWRWSHLAVVLVIGFLLSLTGLVGAGDAKFAAAMAPFIAPGDVRLFLFLFSAVLLASFVAHRGLKRVPAFRRATPDWQSWERKEFPMGLALGSVLILYLGLGVLRGA